MVTFFSRYSQDGQTVATLQANGQDMEYVINDIKANTSVKHSLSQKLSDKLHDEVLRIAELVWFTKDEYVIKFGFRPVSDELWTLLKACWQEMTNKENKEYRWIPSC